MPLHVSSTIVLIIRRSKLNYTEIMFMFVNKKEYRLQGLRKKNTVQNRSAQTR